MDVSAQEEKKAARGSGKPSLGAPVISDPKGKKKGKNKDNLIGRGKEGMSIALVLSTLSHLAIAAVEKDDFFDMIRSGGIVSKV